MGLKEESYEKIQEILERFKVWILDKQPISPHDWIDAALDLNILVEDVDDRIALMEATMAEKEMELLQQEMSAAAAKKLCKGAVEYREYVKMKSLRNRIDEFIRLAKKKAEIEQRYH